MAERPVIIVGAGASFHAEAPGLQKLLRTVLAAEPQKLSDLDAFLREYFRNENPRKAPPALPFVLGIIDTALDRKQNLGSSWGLDRLREVRRQIDYGIFSALKDIKDQGPYRRLVAWLAEAEGDPTIVSANYDLLIDSALIQHAEDAGRGLCLPDYGCDISTQEYRDHTKFGHLYKLTGSLHFTHCPVCQRLDGLFYSADKKPSAAVGCFDSALLGDAYRKKRRECPRQKCGGGMRPVLVTPTPVQEDLNPHIAQARYVAERALQQADAVIFIGYAMNPSDLALNYLFQRALACLPPEKITVVANNFGDVHRRYMDAFGPRIRWTGLTFSDWMDSISPVASY